MKQLSTIRQSKIPRPAGSAALTAVMLALSAVLTVSGCGKDDQPAETTSQSERPSMVQRQAPQREARQEPADTSPDQDFRVIPKLEPGVDEDGMGLELIIDASSKDAYAQSLRWIAEDASKEQLARLERSVRYIHMYDSSVLGSEQRMLQLINGKTGNEVIGHAANIAQNRRGGG